MNVLRKKLIFTVEINNEWLVIGIGSTQNKNRVSSWWCRCSRNGCCCDIWSWCWFKTIEITARTSSRTIFLKFSSIFLTFFLKMTSQGQSSCLVLNRAKQSSSHCSLFWQWYTHLPRVKLLSSMHRFQFWLFSTTLIRIFLNNRIDLGIGRYWHLSGNFD